MKVISSPPLSRYIVIRQYAHKKLLDELYNIIYLKDTYCYDDLKVIKSILKSLSFLKSNALVRREVIIGIWKVLGSVIKKIESEKEEIISIVKPSICKRISNIQELFGKKNCKIIKLQSQLELAKGFLSELEFDIYSMNKTEIIRNFSRDVQFFIKNTIVRDEAKATFLGELLRRGEELTSFKTVTISDTFLSLNKDILLQSVNDNPNLVSEFINFLVRLFYDNTTIIRKTLENFSNEIKKDDKIFSCFYTKTGNELILNDTDDIINKIEEIKTEFIYKVEREYYYSSFKPYLKIKDTIDFVEKLIYVTYTKLKLEDITKNKNKKDIETDTKDLMRLFASIMGADAAFWTMKKENELSNGTKDYICYVISQYKLDDQISQGKLTDDYFTNTVFVNKRQRRFPLVPKYNLDNKYDEKIPDNKTSLAVFYISNNDDSINKKNSESKDIVASITFIYNKDNKQAKNEKDFRIFIHESGRLMLLLKKEIERYIIDYLIKDKALDLWIQKFWSAKRFEKIYAHNAHIFNSVYKEMEEFEHLEEQRIKKFSKTWYHLTNETINFLYSNIEQNSNNTKHYLNINSYKSIINSQNTIGKTFNKKFMLFISTLLETRWKDKAKAANGKIIKNRITINGYDVDKFHIDKVLGSAKLSCNKHLIRTFVVQCLNNSLGSVSKHGHRGAGEIKNVYLTITSNSITIEDSCLNEEPFFNKEEMKSIIKEFAAKKKYIKDMKCDEYSSTTLTSLQGVVNYLKNKHLNYACDFGFNDNNNFVLTIKFN